MRKKIRENTVSYGIVVEEFTRAVGRPPRDQQEFDDFGHYVKNGLDAQIDWDVVTQCAAEAMEQFKNAARGDPHV